MNLLSHFKYSPIGIYFALTNMYEQVSNMFLTTVLVEEFEDVKQVMSLVSSVKEDKKLDEGVYLLFMFFPLCCT